MAFLLASGSLPVTGRPSIFAGRIARMLLFLWTLIPIQASALIIGPVTIWTVNQSGSELTYGGTGNWSSAGPTNLFISENGGALSGSFAAGGSRSDGIYNFDFHVDSHSSLPQSYYAISFGFNPGSGSFRMVSTFVAINDDCAADCIGTSNAMLGFGGMNGPTGTSAVVSGTPVSLLSFSIHSGGTDLVGANSLGPNGYADYYGSFSIRIGNVTSVPEPGGFSMLLLGLSVLGFALRTRKG